MIRCHPIVLLAGLLTVVRAQGQCVARHPSSSFILILRFPLWRNYVLLCVLPNFALYYSGTPPRRYLCTARDRTEHSDLGEITVSSSAKIAETPSGGFLALRVSTRLSSRETEKVKRLFLPEGTNLITIEQ